MAELVTTYSIGDKVKQAPDFKEIYSNVFRATSSNWDIQLTFTRAKTTATGETSMEDQVTIFVSPAQAKAIAQSLANAVKGYEAQFGDIQIPGGPEMIRQDNAK